MTTTKIRVAKLKQDRRCHVVPSLVAGAPSVLPQAIGCKAVSGIADGNHQKQPRSEDRTRKLPHPVADHVSIFHSAGCPHSQAHCGVDVAA